MRIGIAVRTWGEIGGPGTYGRNVTTALLSLDRQNRYSLFYENPALMGTFESQDNVDEIHVPTFGKPIQLRTWIWDQMALPRYARRENVDVIFHTKFAIPLFTGRKTAMVLHGTERAVHPEFHQRMDLLFFKTVYQQFLRRASVIIAVSDNARRDAIEIYGLSPDRVKTVYLAADASFRVIDDQAHLERIRRQYNLPSRFIVFVGHIYPGKNIGRLIKAFAEVRREHDVHLVIAGRHRWRYQEELDLIPKLGLDEFVHLVGHIAHEDLVAVYNLAELMALPSFYESFGLVTVEAQACGCPVVVSQTGGAPEAAGDGAIYVDPWDEKSIADGMTEVLSNEAQRGELVAKGFRNAERFSWEKTARGTLEVLKTLAEP